MTRQASGPRSADAASDFKSCCAEAYSADWVTLLLGESFHPGGLDLTHRLISHLGLRPDERLLDVASGRGASALAIAETHPIEVCGVDLATRNVEQARTAAASAGLTARVEFRLGDAEALPVGEGEFDAVICECALCTFPDKPTALAQMARALRPGGRIGISDVTAELDRLPARLRTWAARIACIGAAGSSTDYRDLLAAAGFMVEVVEAHDDALLAMVERVEARLSVLGMLSRSGAIPALDRDEVTAVIADVRAAVSAGHLGYSLFVAQK